MNTIATPGIKSPSAIISEERPRVFKILWNCVATKKAINPTKIVEIRLVVIIPFIFLKAKYR